MFRLFKSDFFNFEALRLLSFTAHEGGEVAEFMAAVGQITDLDLESWYMVWIEAASKAEELAREAELSGNRVAARRAFFRASNYQRAAQFMLDGRKAATGQDPRMLYDSEAAISNFWRAVNLMDSSVRKLEVPYSPSGSDDDIIKLPAYLHLPHPSKRRAGTHLPLLFNTVGADATQEEIFYILPMTALELGYAVLTFEGPGQGIVIRRHNIPFRPDWEVIVSTVVDFTLAYLDSHPELPPIDRDRLALAGSSMGGYLSLRGAADARIKACVAIDPFYRMWDMLKGRVPDSAAQAFAVDSVVPEAAWDGLSAVLGWWNVQTRWESGLTSWMLGATSTADMFRRMQAYTLEGHLERVHCPVFVTGARFSLYCQPEVSTERIYSELIGHGNKNVVKWIAENPAQGGLQSKVGAFTVLNQKIFAWLDGVFGIDRKIRANNEV